MAEWPRSIIVLCLALLSKCSANPVNTESPSIIQDHEIDSPHTRKLLGSSVVTSVSVIMDHGNGTKTYITDGSSHSSDTTSGQLGRPPQVVGTPGTLLAPDRYEFYTFGKEGELVKKLMTLEQIQSLIAATGAEEDDDLSDQPVYYHQPLVEAGDSEGVSKVLESVHNVLKGELEAAAAAGQHSGEVPLLPDQSWTILLPGLLNNDMDLKEPLTTEPKQPIPTKPSTTTTTTTTTHATTRFPPRRTTTAAPVSLTTPQQEYRPTTSHIKPATQTAPPNRFTTVSKVPQSTHNNYHHHQQHNNQQLASSSILTPQYTSIKAPPTSTKKPTTSGISTTIKYSAHYTTPYPTFPPKYSTNYVKPQNAGGAKPSGISVKKPIPTKTPTTSTTTAQTTTESVKIESTTSKVVDNFTSTTATLNTTSKATTGPPITTYKASTTSPLKINTGSVINNLVHRTTTQTVYKPTTYRPSTTSRPQPLKYTQSQRPSGIPTIVHYLPMHSMSPSQAPVFTTTPAKISSEIMNQTQKVSTQQHSTTTTTTSPTTITTTNFEESSTVTPIEYKEETTAQAMEAKYPSTASITTKNHYTVINAVKSPPTTVKPAKITQPSFTEITTESDEETQPTAALLVVQQAATLKEEDAGDTVSVSILEDTTRPIEIMTTSGKIRPTTNAVPDENLVQTSSTIDESLRTTTKMTTTPRPPSSTAPPPPPPSTIMVKLSTRPPYRNTTPHVSTTGANKTGRPSTRPAVVHRRTTTAAPPPPKRGTVSYTPLVQLYKSTVAPTRKPIRTPVTSSTPAVTTSRPSTVPRRPVITSTTSTTTRKPTTTVTTTTTIRTTTTTKPTESTTTATTTTFQPTETTTYNTKMPLEQIPLKLIENLKEHSNHQIVNEMPSTVVTDKYSTVQDQDSSTTESVSVETTYITVPTTLTTFPNKMVIVNNSEPFIVKQSITEQELFGLPSNNEALSQTTTTLPSTIEYSTTDNNGDITTTMETMTTFKDQVLEEGINAVTNLLLDGDQKKEFLLNMTRPLGIFNNTLLNTITTTEDDEQNATTVTTEETTAAATDSVSTVLTQSSEEKSEIRLDEVELTENYEETVSTTTVASTAAEVTSEMMSTITTETAEAEVEAETEKVDKDLLKISTQNPAHNQVKKHVQQEIKNSLLKDGETKEVDNKTPSKKTDNSTTKPLEEGIVNKLEKVEIKEDILQNNTLPQLNSTNNDTKIIGSQENMNTTGESININTTKPETMKKPIQHVQVKRPTLTKIKPTINRKPLPEKVNNNNSTNQVVKTQAAGEDDEDNTKIPVKLEIKGQPTNEDPKKTHIVPTKESKLNPDIVDEPNQLVELPQQDPSSSITISPVNPATIMTTERVVIHEQIKLQEVDKNNGFNKFNSNRPVYQSPPQELSVPAAAIDLHPAPYESMGLEASTAFLAEDVRRFADLCNELAFKLWTSLTSKGQISSRSLVMSPFAVTSLLAMVFLGARGATSGQMNDILRLDDMVTFNPHQVFQNVTESVLNSKTKGVATAAFVRQLYSDKSKGKLLDFYKERAQQYYQGHVEEINFSTVGDIIRRRTNLLVKRQTLGKVAEYLRGSSLNMKPPLAAFSANIFQTDCELGSTEGRDGEMYFVVRPSTRQRRLVPVPAVVWRQGFLAGYEPSLDATSVCLGPDSVVSTILILPGQQGQVAPGDGLARLEQRLIESSFRRGAWSRLLRSQLPRPGLELQVPRFSHRSVLNVTGALTRMGLRDLFGNKADLRGLNGLSNDLHLSDMVQVNTFSTCGEETVGARHHIETYPASPQRTGRDEHHYDGHSSSPADMLHDYSHNVQQQWDSIPLALRPRQARLPDNPRLRFDRPFLYVVRHNPSGIILHMGRFNPRLLP